MLRKYDQVSLYARFEDASDTIVKCSSTERLLEEPPAIRNAVFFSYHLVWAIGDDEDLDG